MKRLIILCLFLFVGIVGLSYDAAAEPKIQIVATTPDLADIAMHIGGDFVEVKSLATGVEDPHGVPMKPSFAVAMNRADILLLQGLDLEHAFLPGLLEAARNPRILRDAAGYIDCSKYVLPLDVPSRIDRALGDQHPQGNPHYNLDPLGGKAMAKAIAEGLSRNYPAQAEAFRKNLNTYLAELDAHIIQWQKLAAPLQGVKFVSYHPDLIYFAERFGMKPVGTIELRAGVDPSPSHIAELEEMMRKEHVSLVIRERHYPAELANTIAEKAGAHLAEVIVMTKGVPEAKDYISFIDFNIHSLLNALKGTT